MILNAPGFIKIAPRRSVRDKKFERNNLFNMYTEIMSLTWPANNWTKVHILKVLEYWIDCVKNGEMDGKIPWSYLVNTHLIDAIPDRNKKGKAIKEMYKSITGEERKVVTTEKVNQIRSNIIRWFKDLKSIKLNYILSPKSIRNGGGRMSDIPRDVEFAVYKRLYGDCRDYGIVLTTTMIQLYLREACMDHGGYVVFFNNENKKRWEKLQRKKFNGLNTSNEMISDESINSFINNAKRSELQLPTTITNFQSRFPTQTMLLPIKKM